MTRDAEFLNVEPLPAEAAAFVTGRCQKRYRWIEV